MIGLEEWNDQIVLKNELDSQGIEWQDHTYAN